MQGSFASFGRSFALPTVVTPSPAPAPRRFFLAATVFLVYLRSCGHRASAVVNGFRCVGDQWRRQPVHSDLCDGYGIVLLGTIASTLGATHALAHCFARPSVQAHIGYTIFLCTQMRRRTLVAQFLCAPNVHTSVD